jgi:hypothetical protein
MSDIEQAHYDDAIYPRSPPDGDPVTFDAQQALFAYLTGLCCGALIILATTAVVCEVMHLL